MSRSAFAARFTQLVGEPAMRYLARWKMHAALTWLKETDASLGELASRLGYESEAAFSRAFKRLLGIPPGAARRNATPMSPSNPRAESSLMHSRAQSSLPTSLATPD
jgi:AraC-like DNA-binding protein